MLCQFTVCVTGAGAGVDSAREQGKPEAKKYSKCRTPRSGSPQSPVHALLGDVPDLDGVGWYQNLQVE